MGTRRRWLGQWWFLAAIAVLAINDHVLKAQYGNWWTGKISDFAGPVVIATLLAIVFGRTIGVASAAVGFVVLKTVPGVAEMAAPILGGVTLRDHTDLIGLVALIPAWHLMRPPEVDATPPAAVDPPQHPGITRPSGRRGLQVVGLAAAVLVTTATSYEDPSEVTALEYDGQRVYAGDLVAQRWATSSDGGMTWESAPSEPTRQPTSGNLHPCRSDGWCFRASETTIEERPPGGEWRRSFAWTTDQRDQIDYRAHGRSAARFHSVAVAPTEAGEFVVVSAGSEGVMVLDPEGTWHRRSVLGATPTQFRGSMLPLRIGERLLLASGPIALLVILFQAVGHSGTHSTWVRVNYACGAIAIGLLLIIVGGVTYIQGYMGRSEPQAFGITLIVISIAVVAVPSGFLRLVLGSRRPAATTTEARE